MRADDRSSGSASRPAGGASAGGIGAAARLFALPAARLGAAIAAGVLAVSLLAGAVRALPLLLAPGVPLALAAPIARGVLAVSLEIALFVAPPIAWALTAARLVDRGEARALAAIGVRPLRIVASSWPAAIVVAITAALAAAAWGREASRPGRLVRDLVEGARAACVASSSPAAAPVPLLGVAWICLPGEPPRVVGAAPLGGPFALTDARRPPAFSALALDVSDDLRTLRADALELALPALDREHGEARLRAKSAEIRGLAPIGRASNLAPATRALLLGASATALALLAAALILARARRSRIFALALGAAGPAAALLVFSTLERAPSAPSAYLAVPIAGASAMIALDRIARRFRAHERSARAPAPTARSDA